MSGMQMLAVCVVKNLCTFTDLTDLTYLLTSSTDTMSFAAAYFFYSKI